MICKVNLCHCPAWYYETVNNYYEAVKLMKARTTDIVSILAVLLTFASLTGSFGSTAFAQGNQSQQQQQQNQTGGAQTPALGNASQLPQVLGNNTSVLSENKPIGNENISTTEKMNREQTSLDNKTEAKNMTKQQGAGTTDNQSQQNQTSQQQGQNTSQSASSSNNATNQSQQQGQNNNTNPLSNIPVLGKLFGGK
jgi:hypothetical protein